MSYCPRTDSHDSYYVAIAAIRERMVRNGEVPPNPNSPDELRWAKEGPVQR